MIGNNSHTFKLQCGVIVEYIIAIVTIVLKSDIIDCDLLRP